MPSPFGRNARPHGMSESLAMVFTVPGLPEPPPPPFFVLTVTGADCADALFARSRARTRNVNDVFAARLPTVAVVVLASVLATGVVAPFWNTSYPARPIPPVLSFEAFHTRVTVLFVCAVECRLAGTLGGVLSLDGLVVAVASLLSCDEFPAASRATIVNTNCVPGVSLVTVAFSVVPLTF